MSISESGANVLSLGMSGTEEMYWAVTQYQACVGIEITASHNPIDYNGMKIAGRGSQPLTDKEFSDIRLLAEASNFIQPLKLGLVLNKKRVARDAYIKKVLEFVDCSILKPFKIVINSGNGAAGPTLDAINKKLKDNGVETNFVFVHHNPDPSFPNGIPNPLIEENQSSTAAIVVRENADFGVAFDGDFDRCFFFDHFGNFVPSEYVVGLLAEVFISREKGATIIHDPRVIWNTKDVINRCGGLAVASKTGHAFMKAAMRHADAIYGGEMSAHHYFRDFFYCDSGIIPWLLVWELISTSNRSLSDLISERKKGFPSSGELNFNVVDPVTCMATIQRHLASTAVLVDELDGLSMSFDAWRFNLRKSNTESLIRLNIETRGDYLLLEEKIHELKDLIKQP